MTDQTNKLIDSLIRDEILAMQAYHVQPAEGLVKLDMMENPYQWTGELKNQWLKSLEQVSVNRYPDPSAEKVKSMLLTQSPLPSIVMSFLATDRMN